MANLNQSGPRGFAWEKYVETNENWKELVLEIEYTVKEAPIYDERGLNIRQEFLVAKDTVTLKSNKYVEIKGKKYAKTNKGLIQLAHLRKPTGTGRAESDLLKPQKFGTQGTAHYTYDQYTNLILNSLKTRKDIPLQLALYLTKLFRYYMGQATKAEVANSFEDVEDMWVGAIGKDFGETVGPIGVVKEDLLSKIKLRATKGSIKINFPDAQNMPFLDYLLDVDRTPVKISAKSGKATNTVKPGPLVEAIDSSGPMKTKWQNRQEYKIMQILKREPVRGGSMFVANHLKLAGGTISKAAAESIRDKNENYDDELLSHFILNNKYLSNLHKRPSGLEISYEADKLVVEYCNRKYNFNELFKDAINSDLIYIMFEVTKNNPEGKWKVNTGADYMNQRVGLRSKNGYTRAEDRLGLQP